MSALDLGSGHVLRWAAWDPDRRLNPQYAGVPGIERAVALIRHPLLPGDDHAGCRENGYCEGALWPDTPEVRRWLDPPAVWQVLSWDPLTLNPSVRCHCGDHGSIQQGCWVPSPG